jgi:uncharacterized protein (DUF433 family)
MQFSRITVEPEKMGGVPCIRGLRIPVATVVGMIANEMSIPSILSEYPDLQEKDIYEALAYAPKRLGNANCRWWRLIDSAFVTS